MGFSDKELDHFRCGRKRRRHGIVQHNLKQWRNTQTDCLIIPLFILFYKERSSETPRLVSLLLFYTTDSYSYFKFTPLRLDEKGYGYQYLMVYVDVFILCLLFSTPLHDHPQCLDFYVLSTSVILRQTNRTLS